MVDAQVLSTELIVLATLTKGGQFLYCLWALQSMLRRGGYSFVKFQVMLLAMNGFFATLLILWSIPQTKAFKEAYPYLYCISVGVYYFIDWASQILVLWLVSMKFYLISKQLEFATQQQRLDNSDSRDSSTI